MDPVFKSHCEFDVACHQDFTRCTIFESPDRSCEQLLKRQTVYNILSNSFCGACWISYFISKMAPSLLEDVGLYEKKEIRIGMEWTFLAIHLVFLSSGSGTGKWCRSLNTKLPTQTPASKRPVWWHFSRFPFSNLNPYILGHERCDLDPVL